MLLTVARLSGSRFESSFIRGCVGCAIREQSAAGKASLERQAQNLQWKEANLLGQKNLAYRVKPASCFCVHEPLHPLRARFINKVFIVAMAGDASGIDLRFKTPFRSRH